MPDGELAPDLRRLGKGVIWEIKRMNEQVREHAKFYNSNLWRQLRRTKLDNTPICEICKHEPAAIVHLLVSLGDSGKFLAEMSNLESLCFKCYAILVIKCVKSKSPRKTKSNRRYKK